MLVPHAHVVGMPDQLLAALQELGSQRLVAAAVADVPLTGGDDLERPVAVLVELDRVGDRLRLAHDVAGLMQQLDDAGLGLLDRLARELLVGAAGVVGPDLARKLRRSGQQPAVPADHRPRGELQLAPPGDVGGVAERADHRDARPLLGISERVRAHWHLGVEQRGEHLGAEQLAVALVVGMGDERNAGGDELGPCGLDHDVAGAVDPGELHRVVGAGHLTVFQLGLRHRGAEVDVPQRGRLGLVRLTPSEVPQERALRDPLRGLADRGVGHRPVDRQPGAAPQVSRRRARLRP